MIHEKKIILNGLLEKYRTVGNMGELPDGSVKRFSMSGESGGTGGTLRDGWNVCSTTNETSLV